MLGAWALTSSGPPWAGPGDLTIRFATDCISFPTLIRTLRVPPPSVGPNRVPGAPAGRGSRATTHLGTAGWPWDPLGTASFERVDADGASRRCTTPKAHPAVWTQRGLRSTWERHSTPGRVDRIGLTGLEHLCGSDCMNSEGSHGRSHDWRRLTALLSGHGANRRQSSYDYSTNRRF
jgi:hypothetical protein